MLYCYFGHTVRSALFKANIIPNTIDCLCLTYDKQYIAIDYSRRFLIITVYLSQPISKLRITDLQIESVGKFGYKNRSEYNLIIYSIGIYRKVVESGCRDITFPALLCIATSCISFTPPQVALFVI